MESGVGGHRTVKAWSALYLNPPEQPTVLCMDEKAIGNRVHSHPTSARDGAALHDRQMALGKVHLNTYLIADMMRNPTEPGTTAAAEQRPSPPEPTHPLFCRPELARVATFTEICPASFAARER